MAESGLDYKTLRVSDLFSQYNYYQVPKYQRDYAWTNEEIDELMEDLLEAWREYGKDAYLLGQIIVCPAQDELKSIDTTIEQWDLIDGQQRCTTLLLLLLVASKLIKHSDEDSKSLISKGFDIRDKVTFIKKKPYFLISEIKKMMFTLKNDKN